MRDEVSARARQIHPFVVMDVVAKAKRLIAEGRDVVRLEIGDPDMPTPPAVTEAAERAMEEGDTGYTESLGLLDLRDAVSEHYARTYGVTVDPAHVVVTQGTSPAMLLTFGTLLDPGDEVIVSDPCYPAYRNYATFLGGTPVPIRVRAEEGFRFRLDELARAVGPRTRAVMINSPSNPTGSVLGEEDLRAVAALAEEHGLWVVSDEIYHGLDYGGESHSILEYTDRAFVLNGFSKAYAMTGWRLGYLIAPKDYVRPAECIQQNFFLCANHFVQVAGVAALTLAQRDMAEMRVAYDERRRYLVPALRGSGLGIATEPTGAFYVFADAREWGEDSLALAGRLLDEAGVAAAPGIDFGEGGEGFLRFSYATGLDRLELAVERMRAWRAGEPVPGW